MTGSDWRADRILVWNRNPSQMTGYDVAAAVSEFVRSALRYDIISEDELPEEALLSNAFYGFDLQVSNGGHWQFAVNTRMPDALISRVERCLHAIGVCEHIELFGRFVELVQHTPALPPVELLDDRAWRPEGLKELDSSFFEARQRTGLWDPYADWMRGTGRLEFKPSIPDLDASITALIESHPSFPSRRAEVEARRAADAKDAADRLRRSHERAARLLCDAAGLRLLDVREPIPTETPGVLLLPIVTTKGERVVRLAEMSATLMKDAATPTRFATDWPYRAIREVPSVDGIASRIRRFLS